MVGQRMFIPITITSGFATYIRAWLSDGVTQAEITANPGIALILQPVQPIVTKSGNWRLWAEARDACGQRAQTGLIRNVIVK